MGAAIGGSNYAQQVLAQDQSSDVKNAALSQAQGILNYGGPATADVYVDQDQTGDQSIDQNAGNAEATENTTFTVS